MSNFQTEMNRVVHDFVAQITELARAAARDMFDQALGKAGEDRARGRRSGKRTSDELGTLAETFHAFVTKHPGLRIEQINKQLGTNTKELALPIRKMIAEGTLKTKGDKRSTAYFADNKKKS